MIKSAWRLIMLAAAASLCTTAMAAGQSASSDDLGIGKLLVSSKGLPDPNFAKSVILLIQYDQQGAVGLEINRHTEAPVSRVLQGVDTAKHASDPIYIGGPVEMETVLALVKSQKKPDDSTSVLSDVYLVPTKPALEKALAVGSSGGDLRVYLGYCGWGAGQLENEVRQGGWWIFAANAGVVFDPNPGSLWPRLIVRTEQQIAEAR
ncbi:MAG TPA: YqgE/AlgH family protein [Terriglobia bacterium]|nr:YqgE/AlgH family protein [Terriglobia bacterium]